MEPFAFIVCTKLCVIVEPTEGQTLANCLERMETHKAAHPGERVVCQSLDTYGIWIDGNGTWTRKSCPLGE